MASRRAPLGALPANSPRLRSTSSKGSLGEQLQEAERQLDWYEMEDGAGKRAAQAKVLKRARDQAKENRELRKRLADLAQSQAADAAAKDARIEELQAQLAAAEQGQQAEARDVAENVLELEAALKRTKRKLAEVRGEPEGSAAPADDESPRRVALQAELQAARDADERLAEDLALEKAQHLSAQQDIQRLERRVRELEDQRRGAQAAAAASEDKEDAAEAEPAVVVQTPLRTPLQVAASPALALAKPEPEPVRERQNREEPCMKGFLSKLSKARLGKGGQRFVQLYDFVLQYRKDDGLAHSLPLANPTDPLEQCDETQQEVVVLQLEHARCLPDMGPEGAAVFHVLTPQRPYSFRCESAEERQQWSAAVARCAHDAALIQGSALAGGAQQAGYLVRAARKGRSSHRKVEPDVGKWTLGWWALTDDDRLEHHAQAPATAEAAPSRRYDLLGATVTPVTPGLSGSARVRF